MNYSKLYDFSYKTFILIFILKYFLALSRNFKGTYFDITLDFLLVLNTFILLSAFFYFNRVLKIKLRWKILFILSVILALYNFVFPKPFSIIFIFIYNICAPTKIDTNKFIKTNLYFKIILLMIVIFLSVMRLIPTVEFIRGDTLKYRNSLGFIHPNFLSLYFFSILIDYIYIHKIDIIKLLTSSLFTILLYMITNSRTTFILSIIFIFYTFFIEIGLFKFNKSIYYKILFLSISLFTVIPIFYSSEISILATVNTFISNRLAMANEYINEIGFSYFGSNVPQFIYGKKIYISVLDNGYILLLLSSGTIFFILYFFAIFLELKRNTFSAKFYIMLSFILFLLFFENIGLNPFLFSPLLFEIYKINVERC